MHAIHSYFSLSNGHLSTKATATKEHPKLHNGQLITHRRMVLRKPCVTGLEKVTKLDPTCKCQWLSTLQPMPRITDRSLWEFLYN